VSRAQVENTYTAKGLNFDGNSSLIVKQLISERSKRVNCMLWQCTQNMNKKNMKMKENHKKLTEESSLT
jgi:hypothetical protein